MGKRFLHLALAASLVCSGGTAHAADFIFSFGSDLSDPNVTNAVPGTVTGRIIGLADSGTSSATSVFIDSYSPDGTLALPIDVMLWFSPFDDQNLFTVEEGMIVAAIFQRSDEFGPSFDRLYINVPIYESGGTNYASLGSNNAISIWNNQGLSGITFTRIESLIPEPSTWAMLLLGFGAVGLALRRRRVSGDMRPLTA